ncbi:bifunctional protein-disulfide isomerase/oxidoreductase DsbC [Psychrobium sp. 1_MG-2023]|uniref:bifunctional protein-disulfide isomerase/oxidoreductase DsbC n=1 Tax=Psychrobium sp. 1_MG-2023 TaxID=3062624 RepID=UPI000C32E4B4|nr:bifunctional protein-disulfide isomerase/oxidoreductase DsbC [Psychrobium sp. 1_MG-2023]MDP2562809.1 bifunctional protein-disulfide isomerase/oxidoreductase DsbC [Psychrobium sp. 1_MG-2023]PKF54442.1 bifunctional protein-disulfide isomerase/oxidoreductase DsbC [Alteromonadales bacterium alter-6D02]
MYLIHKLLAALLVLTPLFIQAKSIDPTIEEQITQTIKNKLGISVDKLEVSKLEGVIEVYTERGLLYVSANGKYLIHGKVYDMSNDMDNLTERSLMAVRVEEINSFAEQMIIYPAKNEIHKVTVYVDTSCGYCRKLHSQMKEYNDLGITVQYLAFPRSGTSGSTFKEMSNLWCSANPDTAMTQAMSGSRSTVSEVNKICGSILEKQYQSGMKVGVSGTPAIVLKDGSMIPGYQGPQDLLQALNSLK